MTENRCVCCGRPTVDGYACVTCGIAKPGEQLRQIADMTAAARDVAHGLSRHGGGGAGGKPGSRLPLDLGATSRLDAVQGTLGTWMWHVTAERGIGFDVDQTDLIVGLARFHLEHLEWWRHRPEVDEFLADVTAAARVVASIARGPAAQRYLGPCGALLVEDYERADYDGIIAESATTRVCEGDIYAREGASVGRCRTCGAEVSTDARRAWLDEQVADKQLTARASLIADAYGINVKTIRGWATERRAPNGTLIREAKLRSYYRAGEHVVPWTEPAEGEDVKARGPRLYYVADVLHLARKAADQRAESEAARERRHAAA